MSRGRASLLLALVSVAACGLALAFQWWRAGPPGLPSERELAGSLAERWGVEVELSGLSVKPEGGNRFRVTIAELKLRDADTGLSARAERLTAQVRGSSLDSVQFESLRAERGALQVALDRDGRPRLPARLSGAGPLGELTALDVPQLELTLSGPDAVELRAPAARLAIEPASTTGSGAPRRVVLRGARAQMRWRDRTAELRELALSFDSAGAAPRAQAELSTELAGAPAQGRIQLDGKRVQLELTLSERALRAPSARASTELGSVAAQASLSAELGEWSWTGTARGNLRLQKLDALGSLPWQGAVSVAGEVIGLDGSLQLGVDAWPITVEIDATGLRSVTTHARGVALAPLSSALAQGDGPAWLASARELRGDLQATWQVTGATAGLRAELRVPHAQLGAATLRDLEIEVEATATEQSTTLRARAALLDWQGLEAKEPRADLQLTGSAAKLSATGTIQLPALRLDGYLARSGGSDALRGQASGSVALTRGVLHDPASWTATLTLTALSLTQDSVQLQAAEPLRVTLAEGFARLPTTRITAPDTELVLAGEARLDGELALSLTGTTRLSRLSAAYPALRNTEGDVVHDLRLHGPWSAPALDGELTIHDARVECLGESLIGLDAKLRLEHGALQLHEATARVRDGRVRATGRLELHGLQVGAASLELRAGDFALEPTPGATAKLRLDAQLHAEVGTDLPRISGTLRVLDGAYRRALPLPALPALLVQGLGERATSAQGEPARVQLELAIAFEPSIKLRNNLADATLSVHPTQGLRLTGTDAAPKLRGRLQLEGRLMFHTNEFRLDDAGFEFRPDAGLWPHTDLTGVTDRGVRLRMTGPASDLTLAVRCDSAASTEAPFQCRIENGDARCDRFEALVERFQCRSP